MSNDTENGTLCCSTRCWSVCGYLAAVVGGILIIWGVNEMLRAYTQPIERDVRAVRAAERKQESDKMKQTEASEAAYGWVNQPKGIARLTVARGMDLVVSEYGDPKTARKTLNARLADATAQPPKAPEAPSAFE